MKLKVWLNQIKWYFLKCLFTFCFLWQLRITAAPFEGNRFLTRVMFFAKKVELYNILVLFFRLDFHTESKKYIIICRDLHRTWSFPWSNLCNASAKLWYFLNLIGSLPFSNNDVSVKSSFFRLKSWFLNMTQSTLEWKMITSSMSLIMCKICCSNFWFVRI